MRIVVLLIAGLVSMVLALSRGPDEESHEAILRALRTVDLTYAAMQRDVLQARSGILKNYDFLGMAIDRMHAEVQVIAAVSSSVSVEDRSRLESRLAVVGRSIEKNEAMIERFKSGNAMVQNSLRIFVQTLGEMRIRPRTADVAAFLEAQQLGQQMWQFQNDQDRALAAQIHRSLMALRGMPLSGSEDLKTAVADHGLLILRVLPAVDEIVGATQAVQSLEGSQELQREYFQQFGQMNARMANIRLILSVISLGLCAYATYLALRLKFLADSLSWRLHVEQSVNDAVTRLSLEPERFRRVMNEALVRMGEVFGFETVCLIDLDPDDWSVKSCFSKQEHDGACSLLTQDFLDDLRARREPFKDLVLWRHSAPSSRLAGMRDSLRKRKPLAVASLVRHEGLAVMMVAECQSAYWNMRTDAQILRMTTELLALAIEKHQRLADLEELDRRLEETQRLEAVGTLAGGVAHEFNNILMAIMGYAEMAAGALHPDLPTRRYVDNVLGAGRRAKLVVDQMLAFGRMRRNPAQPFDAVEAAADMLPVIEVCVPPGVTLHLELPDDPLVMMGSPIEIQQVLVNLCKNAGEAIAGSGHIKLAIDAVEIGLDRPLKHGHLRAGRHIRIAVTDTGPGIAPAQLQRIFEPFFTTKGDGGTGLGLSVVHGTVQSLKGAMHVASIPGRGTRFELYFPRVDTGGVALRDPRRSEAAAIGNGELVAVVDAREASRLMWEEKVAALGYEPAGFDSVARLAEWCRTQRPDAAFVVLGDGGNDGADKDAAAALPADLPLVYLLEGFLRTVPSPGAAHRVLKMPAGARDLAEALGAVLNEAGAPTTPLKVAAAGR